LRDIIAGVRSVLGYHVFLRDDMFKHFDRTPKLWWTDRHSKPH